MASRLKTAFRVLLDIVELYIPMLAFLSIFVCFLLQIVSRYFFTPLMWPEELALISFLWAALLGALYAKRSDSMVCFSMLYDAVGPKAQRWMRITGNTLLAVVLAISFKPSLDYVVFMKFKTSATLGIPLNIAYSCYIVFLADIVVRYAADVVRDVRGLSAGNAGGAA
jgi:TRAP-type C4-dicarboxylate transport system permease small subunit